MEGQCGLVALECGKMKFCASAASSPAYLSQCWWTDGWNDDLHSYFYYSPGLKLDSPDWPMGFSDLHLTLYTPCILSTGVLMLLSSTTLAGYLHVWLMEIYCMHEVSMISVHLWAEDVNLSKLVCCGSSCFTCVVFWVRGVAPLPLILWGVWERSVLLLPEMPTWLPQVTRSHRGPVRGSRISHHYLSNQAQHQDLPALKCCRSRGLCQIATDCCKNTLF